MSRLLASCFAMVLLSVMVQSADDAKSTVTKLNDGWLAAHKAADFERLAARYTEDAVVMSPEGEPVQGREAIRNFFAEDFKYVPKRSITLTSLRVEASGDVLIDAGDYSYDGINAEGKSVHITGNYNTVFKKTDGNWHIVIDIWNANAGGNKVNFWSAAVCVNH